MPAALIHRMHALADLRGASSPLRLMFGNPTEDGASTRRSRRDRIDAIWTSLERKAAHWRAAEGGAHPAGSYAALLSVPREYSFDDFRTAADTARGHRIEDVRLGRPDHYYRFVVRQRKPDNQQEDT